MSDYPFEQIVDFYRTLTSDKQDIQRFIDLFVVVATQRYLQNFLLFKYKIVSLHVKAGSFRRTVVPTKLLPSFIL